MKKSVKVFLLILVCITILCLSGCSGENNTPSTTAYFFLAEELHNFPHNSYVYSYNPVQSYESNAIVLSSKQQVDDLFGTAYSATWSNYQENWLRDNRFADIVNKFDEKYFENKHVLTFFTTAANSTNYFKQKDVVFEPGKSSGPGKLTVRLNHLSTVPETAPGTGTQTSWFAIIEIQKIQPDTLIEIKILDRNW